MSDNACSQDLRASSWRPVRQYASPRWSLDFAVLRFESGRALHELDRLLIVAEAVVRPAETVEQIAVVRFELYGLLEQRQALLQLEIPVDPVKAETIENRGLIGIELHRLEKIRLGLGPFAEPLVAHAATVPPGPVRLLRLAGELDRLGVIFGGAFEIALAAPGIAANAIGPAYISDRDGSPRCNP